MTRGEKLYERARAICEKTLGAEHPSTATMLDSLARVYSDTGRTAMPSSSRSRYW